MATSKYEIQYLPLFEKDFSEIIIYIAEKLENEKAANRLIDKVEKAILERAENPIAYEKYNSIKERKYPYYRLYVDNFTIFYVVIDNVIEIRRILYNKRNTENFIGR